MSDISNIERFLQGFEDLKEALTLTNDPDLANDLGTAYSDTLKDRAAAGAGPDGVRWDDNQPDYARRKGGLPVGVGLTGQMLDPDNLRVDASFRGNMIYFTYGGSEEARQHLQFFEQGGRQLWGLDEDAIGRLHEVISTYIGNKVRG